MGESTNETQRIRQRFDVDLKAEVTLEGSIAHELQCRVANLSASGACLHFETAPPCSVGAHIAIKLFIPATIMHIPNTAEIMWTKKHGTAVHTGIRFKDILSEIIMQRLVKNGLPEPPYKPQ